MPSNLPKFTFRTDKETMDKFRFIAESHFRTVNKELEMIVKDYIMTYENEEADEDTYPWQIP